MDKRRIDLSGQVIGHLTVIEAVPTSGLKHSEWNCRCICGKEIIERTSYLRKGGDRSCGCITAYRQYGKARKPPSIKTCTEYNSYCCMKARCFKPYDICYKYYGGRGISVCDRWLGINGFENFLFDMGTKPSLKHSLDRIDVNGNYEPSNCRWASIAEQAVNKRRTLWFEWSGKNRTFSEIALMEGVTRESLRHWVIKRGLTINEAVERAKSGKLNRKVQLTATY